ncbi:hypothetical protein NGRA_0445 [Nosema granulosis]|uniref:Uncharacterized protein n=1 Tax=Nosema granulosis TaxID=83296 RepID=A0A9P6L0J1_9MICR|nr:hypothetical protein NGRA_0445 [Nosema granulosis]
MKILELQRILANLSFILSKVLVIDDLGVTNSLKTNKKVLIDKVRQKINSGNEEVVIYGKNEINRDTRISSREIDLKNKLKKQKELQEQIQRLNNQKIINNLKKLIGMQEPAFNNSQKEKNPNVVRDFEGMSGGIEIDEPVIERSPYERPPQERLSTQFDRPPYEKPIIERTPPPPYDRSPPPSSYERTPPPPYDRSPQPLLFNLDTIPPQEYSPPPPSYSFQPNSTKKNDPYDFNSSPPNNNTEYSHTQHFVFDDFPGKNQTINDNISVLRNEEKANLLKAINNRKEYLRIKIGEVHTKKEKIAQQLGDYKAKIDEIVNRINSIKNNRDSLLTKMNMEKNHISNLTQNSKDIKDKENKLKALIRVTRNEIIRYKSLLENEKSKMDVLEKQYEVYDNTLRRYEGDINQEGNNLSKFTNDLSKYENDLKDLNSMFSLYSNKNNELNEELKRQGRLESNLQIEESKIDRNHIDDLI